MRHRTLYPDDVTVLPWRLFPKERAYVHEQDGRRVLDVLPSAPPHQVRGSTGKLMDD